MVTMDFIDLKSQYRAYQSEIDLAIQEVLRSCAFIHGPQVDHLEKALSDFTGTPHAIACASGTDALLVPLLALGLQPGDEVIVPDFTFFATAEVVALLGAKPIFADIHPATWNLDAADVAKKLTPRTRGIIAASLFGQCADMQALSNLAQTNSLWLMEDAAQSFGAAQNGKQSCNLSPIATTSFFPAKPLGAYGKGGAIFCTEAPLAAKIRSLLNHGQEGRYHHTLIGMNGRMDTLQAAILLVKLRHFPEELQTRNHIAQRYIRNLDGLVAVPHIQAGNTSAWAQFTVMHPERDRLCKSLAKDGIPTSIHYPTPLHRQPIFQSMGIADASCPVATKISQQVFSLPIHAFMSETQVDQVCEAIARACRESI